jgi:hypothetical protein
MDVLNYSNFTSLNKKYCTIDTISVSRRGYNEYVIKLLNVDENNDSINEMYSELYDNFMNNTIKINVFLDEFKIYIKNRFENKNNVVNLIFSVSELINKLTPFMSFYDFKKITFQNKSIFYHIYNICANEVFDTIQNKYIDTYVYNLINNQHKIVEITKIFGKFFTNGLGYIKEYIDDTPDSSKYDFSVINSFYATIASKINIILDNGFQSKNNISDILDKINEIGLFLNTYLTNDESHIFYKLCYSCWCDKLLQQLTFDHQMIPVIIGHLQLIEPYIGSDMLANDIGLKIKNLIQYKLKSFEPYNNHFANIDFYNKLIDVSILCEMVLNGWHKYKSLYDQLTEICDNIFKSDVIDYFYLCIKKSIEDYCTTTEDITDKIQKNIFTGISLTIRTKEIDRCITNYITYLQKRYINMNYDSSYDFKKMFQLDKMIFQHICDFTNNDIQLKNHTSNVMNKFKNIINDIQVSVKINDELNLIKITYVDTEGNEVSGPTYNSNNIKYLMTTSINSWSDLSNHVSNTYDVNYSNELKHIVCTFNDYYKEKCPQRITKILNDCSTVILNYKLNDVTYKINVTLMQANILMLFQNSNELELQSINEKLVKNQTELTNNNIKHVCNSLVSAKLLNVIDEIYSLNVNMKMPRKYISEPANIAKFYLKHNEPVKTVKQQNKEIIEYDRSNTLKCFVMKCVKSDKDKVFLEKEITDYVCDNLKLFDVTTEDIQKTIKVLLKTYYIDEVSNGYKYADE